MKLFFTEIMSNTIPMTRSNCHLKWRWWSWSPETICVPICLNFVNTKGFQDFLSFCDPKLNLRSDTTYSKFKLPLLHNNIKLAVELVLQNNWKNAVEWQFPLTSGLAETMTLTKQSAFIISTKIGSFVNLS